jgi:hypothetical protein
VNCFGSNRTQEDAWGVPLGKPQVSKGKIHQTVGFEGEYYPTKLIVFILCARKLPEGDICHFDNNPLSNAYSNLYDAVALERLQMLLLA